MARGPSARFNNDLSLYTTIAELSDKKEVGGRREIQVFRSWGAELTALLHGLPVSEGEEMPQSILSQGKLEVWAQR